MEFCGARDGFDLGLLGEEPCERDLRRRGLFARCDGAEQIDELTEGFAEG